MVKDEWEIEQMRSAVEGTHRGFDAVIADLPEAVRRGRGERWVEGVFGLHARHHGNGVGYDSICASGDHANTLHWIKNTGDIRDGDLLLLDAGVEVESLFTADITRTLPVSGTFTDAQRAIYDAVYAAQEAGIAACKPGNRFSDVHAAAIRVIAEHLHAWGLLPEGIDVEATLDPDHGQHHRRWMVHGTSHHLGIDVHDCALATREQYNDAVLEPGMILTVEPGLYFKADDELVPDGVPRQRRPHRGRRADHGRRVRQPLRRDAAHERRRRGVDRAHLGRAASLSAACPAPGPSARPRRGLRARRPTRRGRAPGSAGLHGSTRATRGPASGASTPLPSTPGLHSGSTLMRTAGPAAYRSSEREAGVAPVARPLAHAVGGLRRQRAQQRDDLPAAGGIELRGLPRALGVESAHGDERAPLRREGAVVVESPESA